MDVVGHDHELVEEKFLLIAIVREGFDQKSSSRFAAEDRNSMAVIEVTKKTRSESIPLCSRKSRRVVGERCHIGLWRISKRYTGPKGTGALGGLNAALKGPLFHGIIGGGVQERLVLVGAPSRSHHKLQSEFRSGSTSQAKILVV